MSMRDLMEMARLKETIVNHEKRIADLETMLIKLMQAEQLAPKRAYNRKQANG